MEKIKTFEDACRKLGITEKLPEVSMLPKDQQEAIIAHYKLMIIAQALNGKWKPDWTNDNQYKYYPWFNMESGSGLSFHGCAYWSSYSPVGSRLCFKSRELAEYAGKRFKDLYEQYFVIK